METFVKPGARQASFDIANEIQPLITKAMELRNRGVKTKDLHVTRESKMAAILTEGGFMDSTTDISALRCDTKLKAQGEAVAEGLVTYFKLQLKNTESKPSIKEDDELKFSSPTLKTETETSLTSKAHRQIIVEAAVKAGTHKSWLGKLNNNTITNADVLGLAVKCTVAVNI